MSAVGNRVRKLRGHLGLTQSQFSEKIGVKGGVISAWENGTAPVPYGRVLIICDAYRVNERWLAKGVGDIFVRERRSMSPSREQAFEFVCSFFDKVPDEARREMLDFLREVVARFDEQYVEVPEDPSEYINGKKITIASAEETSTKARSTTTTRTSTTTTPKTSSARKTIARTTIAPNPSTTKTTKKRKKRKARTTTTNTPSTTTVFKQAIKKSGERPVGSSSLSLKSMIGSRQFAA